MAKMHRSIANAVAGTRLYELICTSDGPATVPEEPPSAAEMFLRARISPILAMLPVDVEDRRLPTGWPRGSR